MTVTTRFYSREEPPEYDYGNPINCVVCDAEWDADDHVGDWFKYHEDTDQPVCIDACYATLEAELEGEMEEQDFNLEAA